MGSWAEGYAADTQYTTAYYAQFSPVSIDRSHFFQLHQPVRDSQEFRYFELGCGTGLTTILMAACHPEAYFEANDFMPEHVVIAQNLAAKLGIKNVHLSDASFSDLNKKQFEYFDYIMAHGIYSWVSE
ncbi:MAG: class I SAM-dependent methyltransferase, partial [Pseudomonadota bacterium]